MKRRCIGDAEEMQRRCRGDAELRRGDDAEEMPVLGTLCPPARARLAARDLDRFGPLQLGIRE